VEGDAAARFDTRRQLIVEETNAMSQAGAVVATAFRGPRTTVLLTAYVVASAVVSIPYLQWRRRQARGDEPIAEGA
jgi:hypothetical protein